MSWVTVVSSMIASACLTMALIYGFIWARKREVWVNLLFAIMSLGTAASAGLELAQMRADSPAQIALALRWEHVSVWVAVLALAGFVRLYLHAGRLWLLWAVCGLRTVSLFLNFLTGQNLNYLEVTNLRHISFLGEFVSIARGPPNPWMLVGQLSLFLLVIFVIDAAIAVWRRGDRRKAAVVGGSLVLFAFAGTIQTALIVWGHVQWPVTSSLFFLGIIAAMGYELGGDASRSAKQAEELRALTLDLEVQAHRIRIAHSLRVASLAELSSALANELKQPLTAILSNAQAAQLHLSREIYDTDEIKSILRDIVASEENANNIIERIGALLQKAEAEPQPLDANELIQEVLRMMSHDLKAREVSIVTELAADLPSVLGDRLHLEQVLINLILNASDAMAQPTESPHTLTFRSNRAEGNVVQISVTDTGSGIPSGEEERIFEPCHSTKPQRAGLGLSLSRSIASNHGGRLWAENHARGGATFHFTLPEWNGNPL